MPMWLDILNWIATAYVKNQRVQTESTIDMAKAYLGMTAEHNFYELQMLMGVDPRETGWCSAFVNAIEVKCCRPGTKDLMAKSYLNYGTIATNPIAGDICVFDFGNPDAGEGHVAYFISQDKNNVYCLGGNQDRMVKYKTYNKNSLLSIRHPY